MEKHFLADLVQGTPGFRPAPWYNRGGDCIVYQTANEAVVADRIDGLLTVYNSAADGRPIGFEVKGVGAILSKFGLDALEVTSEANGETVKSISIVLLLLVAYEEGGTSSMDRRKAYAALMGDATQHQTMPVDELQPA